MTHSAAECKKTHSNSFRELLNAFKNAMCVGGQKQRGEAKRKEIGLNPPKERTPQKGKLMQFFKGTTLVPTLPHTTFACVCATSFFSRFLLVFCASEILNHGASAGASIYRSDPSLYFFKTKVKSWNIANGRFHLGAPFWCVRQGWVIRGIQGKRYFLVKEKITSYVNVL